MSTILEKHNILHFILGSATQQILIDPLPAPIQQLQTTAYTSTRHQQEILHSSSLPSKAQRELVVSSTPPLVNLVQPTSHVQSSIQPSQQQQQQQQQEQEQQQQQQSGINNVSKAFHSTSIY